MFLLTFAATENINNILVYGIKTILYAVVVIVAVMQIVPIIWTYSRLLW